MKFHVKVKLKAKEERVRQMDPTHFEIAVKEPPVEGRANESVIRILARHLGIPKSRLRIASGRSGRNKTVEMK